MSVYDVGQNFNPGTGPSFNTRGAYSFVPAEGSSNILGGGMQGQTAGKYFGFLNPQAFEEIAKKDPSGAAFLQLTMNQMQQNTPEALAAQRKQALQDSLEFYKEQGDQQMKYNLVNRGLTALQTGLERGLTKYQDPYAIANLMAGGYAEGARASAGLTQMGQGIPSRQYYRA